MKILTYILNLVLFVTNVLAQTPKRSEKEIFDVITKNIGTDITSVDFFKTASAEESWKAFYFLSYYVRDSDELTKKAGRAIAENPRVEKYVTDGMAKLPHDFYNSGKRAYFLAPLSNVPSPWSLKLLGHYLTDSIPMTYPAVAEDYGASTNLGLAIEALQKMGFSDAPPEDHNFGQTPVVVKGWRDWWKKNEPIVEQRIHEINPGYYPPTPIPAPATLAPASPIIGEYDTTPVPTSKPMATSMISATPKLIRGTDRTSLLAYLVGGSLAVGVLCALAWAFKKQK